MTSDAKIGLLLGLIFIFVIAFVINGLPSLRPPISKVGATTISPGTDVDFTSVTGETERAVSSLPEMLGQPRTGGEPAPVEEPKPAIQEPTPVAQEPPQPQVANNESVRSFLPLPSMERLLDQLTPTIRKDQAATINVDTPGRAAEPPSVSGRQTATAVPQPRLEPAAEPKAPETPTKAADARELVKPATAVSKPVIIPGSTIYTTVSGDNLGVVAKKVYGPEEGNRVANIQRIFHANETTLKSADRVPVGMKLVIPPALPKLSTTPAAPATPADVLPATLFERLKTTTTISEKLQSLSKGALAPTPAPASDARWYTVQNGDSLWKIAASQLGNASRCDEIAKLNAEILKSRDALDVGMKLRLPPK